MRRIFTLLFIGSTLLSIQSFGQCQTPQPANAACSEIVEDFNTTDGGFTGSTGFVYTGTNFSVDAPSGAGLATITSRTFTKTGQLNVVQVGFDLDKQNQQVEIISVTLNVLDATTNGIIASCTRTDIAIGSPTCFGVTNPLIADGASIKLSFIITFNNTAPQGRFISFDNFRQAGANATLPVKFLSLSAKQSAAGTLLTWKVAEEEGVKSYEVEKGTNGKNFSLIGSVPASGNSSYTFNDASSAPVSFYRIKSVDIDGKFGYSTIISLKNGKEVVSMRVYPMPAQRHITVQHAMTTNNAKLLISTGDGRLVKSVIPAVGTMQTEVELSNFKVGLYILSFENGNGTKETMKFIKN
jgi:hypothetical protein